MLLIKTIFSGTSSRETDNDREISRVALKYVLVSGGGGDSR